jgi:integrase
MLTNARPVAVPMKDGKGETFRLHGTLGGERCRLALGTQRKPDAQRLVHKIETAFAEGVSSTLWPELQERLPRMAFQALAEDIGWKEAPFVSEVKPTWEQLRTRYDAHLLKEIAKGNMVESTRTRYLQTIKFFDSYVKAKQITLLEEITKAVIEDWKLHRIEEIKRKAFSRGGTGYILDTAILRGAFNFALSEKMIAENPVVSEGKPGAKPTNGASPFSSEELPKIFEHAGVDLLAVLVLFRTGLRRSDAIRFQFKHVDFKAQQIRLVAQKNDKKIRIPILPDLLAALEMERSKRNAGPEDYVLLQPSTGEPFNAPGKKLYERLKAVGKRAGVKNVRPHRFRDSFAADCFLRGCDTEEVAAYLADTVATVAEHYSDFIEERRARADAKMRNGTGIVPFITPQAVEKSKLRVMRSA